MRTLWTAVLALTVAYPLPAQLREVRPARTAFAFGWSDVTGYGTAVAFVERLRRGPLPPGVSGGGGGGGGPPPGAGAQPLYPPPAPPPRQARFQRAVGTP